MMNVDKSQQLTFSVLLFLLWTIPVTLLAQGPTGAYKEMATAAGITVTDTVEGIDLQVITIEPSANHGDVVISLVSAGGPNTPNRYAVRYTPHAGFSGIDTFTLELNQFFTFPYLHYLAYRVSVFPSQITLKDDYVTTYTNVSITIHALGNDQSNNGPLTLTDIPLVNNGTAYINNQNQIVFTPKPGYNGVAMINYVACDGEGNCKTGQVKVGVRPVTQPPNITLPVATTQNTVVEIPLQFNGYLMWQAPTHGTAEVISSRAFRYTPDAGYIGSDPFILRRNVNGSISTITVDMKVLQAPARNKMAVNDYVYTPEGTPVTFNVRQNDLGNLSVMQWGTPNTGGTLSGATPGGTVTFTPDPGYSGSVVFQYALGNGLAETLETGTVTIVVSNLAPAQDTFYLTTRSFTPFVVDYPIPYEVFDFEISQLPSHGVCTFYPGYISQFIGGQYVQGYNLLVYRPFPGYTGSDVFEVNYCLSANSMCKSTVIRMDVVNIPGVPACVQDCVWPGDANTDGIVNSKDLLTLGFCMGAEGTPRTQGSTTWYGQKASNWNNPFVPLPTDLKHADADGNGRITKEDADVILQHYSRTGNIVPGSPLKKKGLPFIFNLLTPNASVGDVVEVEVSLGSTSEPVTNLYGMTFNAVISPNLVVSDFQMEYYDYSWINRNSPYLTLDISPQQGLLESAFTRTSGQPANGFGVIGKFSFVIIDIVDVGRPENFQYFNITMSNSAVQWGDGVLTNGSNYEMTVPLNYGSRLRNSDDDATVAQLNVYPSPANSIVYVESAEGGILESVTVYDLNGRTVQELKNIGNQQISIPVGHLPNGLYIVSANTAQGIRTQKLRVQH